MHTYVPGIVAVVHIECMQYILYIRNVCVLIQGIQHMHKYVHTTYIHTCTYVQMYVCTVQLRVTSHSIAPYTLATAFTFIAPSGFLAKGLAHILHSLVHVSRRVGTQMLTHYVLSSGYQRIKPSRVYPSKVSSLKDTCIRIYSSSHC